MRKNRPVELTAGSGALLAIIGMLAADCSGHVTLQPNDGKRELRYDCGNITSQVRDLSDCATILSNASRAIEHCAKDAAIVLRVANNLKKPLEIGHCLDLERAVVECECRR